MESDCSVVSNFDEGKKRSQKPKKLYTPLD